MQVCFTSFLAEKSSYGNYNFYYEGLFFPHHFKVVKFMVSENWLANQPELCNFNCPKHPKGSN